MSCNGSCYMITTARINPGGIPYRGNDIGNHAPTPIQRTAPYFQDPNALTAREFELARNPVYVGRRGEVQYLMPEMKSRQMYGTAIPVVQKSKQEDAISRFEADVLYAAMVQAAGILPDYSFQSTLRQAWENVTAMHEQRLTVREALPEGHMRAYTLIGNAVVPEPTQAHKNTKSQTRTNTTEHHPIEEKRTMLEDLIRKERVLLN